MALRILKSVGYWLKYPKLGHIRVEDETEPFSSSNFDANIVVSMFLSGEEMFFVIEICLDNLMASDTDLSILVIGLIAPKNLQQYIQAIEA